MPQGSRWPWVAGHLDPFTGEMAVRIRSRIAAGLASLVCVAFLPVGCDSDRQPGAEPTLSSPASETLPAGGRVELRIERIWWEPGGESIREGGDALITVTEQTEILVRVHNEGTREAQDVTVRLELEQPGGTLELTQHTSVEEGGAQDVAFRPSIAGGLEYAERLPAAIELEPLPGEARADDNVVRFTVVFRLYSLEITEPD